MSQRFEQQISYVALGIQDVRFNFKSRDELPPVLKALQYIFITSDLNEKVFALLQKKLLNVKRKIDYEEMDLWHMLVLAVVRRAVDANWDRLEYIANYDRLVRQIMGLHGMGYLSDDNEIKFDYQTILDNVSLVDETLLEEVNQLVLETGHQLLKKRKRRSL